MTAQLSANQPREGRRYKMCDNCPFRGADENYKREAAEITSDNWPCHEDAGPNNDPAPQCRGHYEARRKYATDPQPSTLNHKPL
jgi:hypothetical protein